MRNQPLPLGGVKYVLFDWDNTLAESRTPLLYALGKVLERRKLPSWEELQKKRDNDLSFKRNFYNFFGDKAEEIYDEYAEIYLQNVKRLIRTYPKVQEVLEFLRCHGVTLMVMSNKDRKLLEYELPLLFNPKCFEKIVSGEEAPRDKPYPEHVYFALEGYLNRDEITPNLVWVVGDSPQDSTCARSSNARPIRIGKDIWSPEEKCSEDTFYYDDFEKFYEALTVQN